MSKPPTPPSVNQKLQSYPLQESSVLDDLVYYRRRNYQLKDMPPPPATIGSEVDVMS